ncbi:hypothetical protein COOONC_25040 [Cooperia oncophora]
MNSIYGSPMKTYSSSPDIPHMNSFELAEDDSSSTTQVGEYSRPFRPAFRPKTPPPPPPPPQSSLPQTPNSQRLPSSPYGSNHVKQNSSNGSATTHIVVPTPNDSGDTPSPPPLPQSSPPSSSKSSIVPPPPPPPPPNLLKLPAASSSTSVGSAKAGISVEALRSVALKKAEPEEKKTQIPVGMTTSGSADFQADLRNALAKRRSKVAQEQDDEDKSDVDGRFGGLSLRETVRENVQTKDVKQHSPPGIANKKDSGYTSSRTSLEPSEYGEERGLDANSNRPHFTVDGSSSRHNVALISQNIEDSYGARKNIDNMSVSSTLSTLSGCSSESRPTPSLPVVPPVDYDDPDSGTGGSDSDMQRLDEYLAAFQARRVDGRALLNCDRAAFTQLGVTRIAHRQKMEASLRRYMGSM